FTRTKSKDDFGGEPDPEFLGGLVSPQNLLHFQNARAIGDLVLAARRRQHLDRLVFHGIDPADHDKIRQRDALREGHLPRSQTAGRPEGRILGCGSRHSRAAFPSEQRQQDQRNRRPRQVQVLKHHQALPRSSQAIDIGPSIAWHVSALRATQFQLSQGVAGDVITSKQNPLRPREDKDRVAKRRLAGQDTAFAERATPNRHPAAPPPPNSKLTCPAGAGSYTSVKAYMPAGSGAAPGSASCTGAGLSPA